MTDALKLYQLGRQHAEKRWESDGSYRGDSESGREAGTGKDGGPLQGTNVSESLR